MSSPDLLQKRRGVMPKSDTDKLAGAPALPFANDGSFMEQFLKMQSEQKASKSDKSSDRATEDDDFIASASFAGAKAGFIFKADKKGLGYYRDAPLGQSKSGATAKPNKPVILKSKPIINVQKRSSSGGELSASKKKKPEGGNHSPLFLFLVLVPCLTWPSCPCSFSFRSSNPQLKGEDSTHRCSVCQLHPSWGWEFLVYQTALREVSGLHIHAFMAPSSTWYFRFPAYLNRVILFCLPHCCTALPPGFGIRRHQR